MAAKQPRSLGFHMGLYFFVIPVICILLVSLVFSLFLLKRNSREAQQRRDELSTQAQVMARELDNFLRAEKTADGEERIRILLRTEGTLIKAIPVLANDQGRILEPRPLNLPQRFTVSVPEEARLESGSDAEVTELDLELLGPVTVAAARLHTSGSQYEAIYLVKRNQDLDQGLNRNLYAYLAIASAVALIISVLLGLALARKISRPVRDLTLAARDIAHGRLDKRVEVRGDREIAELSETFNYMTGRVQEGIELQRDFVANVSHELRTPLTSIEGFSQALLDGVVQGEEQRAHYLEIINAESKRSVRILHDLLVLSRLDAGEVPLRPAPLEVPHFLEELRERFAAAAEAGGITLTVEAPPSLPTLTVDRDRLEQVFINLVDNAIKFTGEGGRVSIAAGIASPGRMVFEVKDTGAGIPPQDLERIFDRFFRVERSRSQQFGGSGLGLAICRQLVEAMGGSIGVQSVLGSGTAFYVNLPL